ncbi:hypothetical protein J6590_043720 [Homalodisca vitripennis]|nr:hypothetical protein J6590_043720 [Homalodisca vitripennis]
MINGTSAGCVNKKGSGECCSYRARSAIKYLGVTGDAKRRPQLSHPGTSAELRDLDLVKRRPQLRYATTSTESSCDLSCVTRRPRLSQAATSAALRDDLD